MEFRDSDPSEKQFSGEAISAGWPTRLRRGEEIGPLLIFSGKLKENLLPGECIASEGFKE